ncbi:MAG: DUF4919 domain-containing protein [Bacteroidota bacterium]
MKQISLFLFLLLLTPITKAQDLAFQYHTDFDSVLTLTQTENHPLYYPGQLKRFHQRDTSLSSFEILALMIGFTKQPYFRPYAYLETERRIYRLNDDGKFQEALQASDSLLALAPFSARALIEKSYALYKLNQPDSSAYYSWKFRSMMEAMAISGKGTSADEAIFALGPADGQLFVQKALASGIGTMGSGRDSLGNFVDILEAIIEDPETGEKNNIRLYFQIQHAVSTMFLDMPEAGDQSKKGKKKKKKRKN